VRKALVDKVVDPVQAWESQHEDFKDVQDNLDEESISYHCDLARGDKGVEQRQAHNIAQYLNKLARHMSHGRTKFMEAAIYVTSTNTKKRESNLLKILK